MKRLWLAFAVVLVFSFSILGWVGTRIYQEAPPLPDQVVTTDGKVVISNGDIVASHEWELDAAVANRPRDVLVDKLLPGIFMQTELGGRLTAEWRRSATCSRLFRFLPITDRDLPHSTTGVLNGT